MTPSPATLSPQDTPRANSFRDDILSAGTDEEYQAAVDALIAGAQQLEHDLEVCRDAHMANCLAADTLRTEIRALRDARVSETATLKVYQCPQCGTGMEEDPSARHSFYAAPQGAGPAVTGTEEPSSLAGAAPSFPSATLEPAELIADPEREGMPNTGVLVRAKTAHGFQSVDISELTGSSLHAWLRSRGGRNVWAENLVLSMLGHPQISEKQ